MVVVPLHQLMSLKLRVLVDNVPVAVECVVESPLVFEVAVEEEFYADFQMDNNSEEVALKVSHPVSFLTSAEM